MADSKMEGINFGSHAEEEVQEVEIGFDPCFDTYELACSGISVQVTGKSGKGGAELTSY